MTRTVQTIQTISIDRQDRLSCDSPGRVMSETRNPGKSWRCSSARDPPSQPPGNRGIDGKFLRCVRRNLRGSQVPVKCHGTIRQHRPPRTQALARLPGTRAETILKSSILANSKKSLSMIDLPAASRLPDIAHIGSEAATSRSIVARNRPEEIGDGPKEMSAHGPSGIDDHDDDDVVVVLRGESTFEGGRAAKLICKVLIMNAWRRRRVEIAELRGTTERLGQQLKHMQMQIIVLRRLLRTENQRVGRIIAEMQRTKARLDETAGQRDALQTEKENIQREMEGLREISEESSVKAENLRNELLTAQDRLIALDAQMAKDREKLLKLREDKRILLDKVSASEAVAGERTSRAVRAETAVEELQIRLAAQVALNESSQEHNRRLIEQLKATEEEKTRLEKAASSRALTLERQLADREAALRQIQSDYNFQLKELNELKERLMRQSQEGRWSSRMLQLAETVVRAPRAILRTLSFLSAASTPFPP